MESKTQNKHMKFFKNLYMVLTFVKMINRKISKLIQRSIWKPYNDQLNCKSERLQIRPYWPRCSEGVVVPDFTRYVFGFLFYFGGGGYELK